MTDRSSDDIGYGSLAESGNVHGVGAGTSGNVVNLDLYMSQELKYLHDLSLARNEKEFYLRVGQILRHMGFYEYSFARLGSKDEIPVPLITMPKSMNEVYFHHGFHLHDLSLQYVMTNTRPIFLSVIEDWVSTSPFSVEIIQQNQEIFKLLADYEYQDFYFVPVRAHNGNGTIMLAVATKDADTKRFRSLVARNKLMLSAVAGAIDLVGTRKFPEVFLGASENRKIVLNPRPLELLSLIGPGDLKLGEAAEKMGISIWTAHRQLVTAKETLDVSTTTGAVYLATKLGLIDEK